MSLLFGLENEPDGGPTILSWARPVAPCHCNRGAMAHDGKVMQERRWERN